MPSPKRRAKRYVGSLTDVERFYLLTGHVTGGADGRYPFSVDGAEVNEDAARRAWEEHRDELTAHTTERYGGRLIPWAAIHFDGATGRTSPYDHLRTEVRARFGASMVTDLPDAETDQTGTAEPIEPLAPDPVASLPSGRFQAVRSWTLADPDLKRSRIEAGEIVDADDEVLRRYPRWFVPYVEGRTS